jgi:hypothetical protein
LIDILFDGLKYIISVIINLFVPSYQIGRLTSV